MKFVPPYKPHTWFHRNNPFNAALKNRLINTLAAAEPQSPRVVPILDQGQEPYCAEYAMCAARQSITGKLYNPLNFLTAVLGYLNQAVSEYQGVDFRTAMETGVLPGFNTNDNYAAVLYIYPQKGIAFSDLLNSYVYQYNRPVHGGITWYEEWWNTQNGIVNMQGKTAAGGHFIIVNGKDARGYTDNPNTWGVGAPGSLQGHYYFDPSIVDTEFANYTFGVGIDSTDKTVIILGKMNALYTKVIDLIQSAGSKLANMI